MTTEIREEELVKLLNEAWALLDPKPKYDDFNFKLSCGNNVEALEKLEKERNILGLSTHTSHAEQMQDREWVTKGMSTLSLIATITDGLIGKRLAAIVEDDGTISGWCWPTYATQEQEEKKL